MTELVLQNLASYALQVAIMAAAGVAMVLALKLTPLARLHCLQFLLACCIVLPLAQPWRTVLVDSSITVTSIPLGVIGGGTMPVEHWRPSPAEAILAVIALGVLVRLALIATGMWRLRGYMDNARLLPTAFPVEKQRVGVWADVFVSEEVRGPATFGLFRPAILLPARWMDRETIVYHELLHVRRRDWFFTVVEELIRAVLWFHPAIWWLIGRIQLTREEVVDRAVVDLLKSREQYLETLLAIAEAKAGLDLAPASPFLKKRHLRQRVAALLKEVYMSKTRLRTSVAGFATVLAAAGWLAIHTFPLQAQSVKDAAGVTVQQDESKLLHRTPVNYPQDAIKKGVQGTVLIEATVDQSGEVTDAQVLSGPQELRRAAIQSVLGWHYNKDAVGPKVQIAIDFTLPPQAQGETPARSLSMSPTTISKVDLSHLPAALRDKVSSRLNVHEGDQVTPSTLAQIRAAIAEVDSHLTVGLGRTAEGGGSLIIMLNGASFSAETPQRIRVGGNVQAANLIRKVQPVYPALAKQARIQGTVRFTVVIGKDGAVQNIQLLSGHPLLVEAAQDAVREWVYKPTLLNGEPVEVLTQIDITFSLNDAPPSDAPVAPPQDR